MSTLFTIIILAILEVSLSFDNAVMNAAVLKNMSRRMQGLFLTLGLAVAVLAVRLTLPALIVAFSLDLPTIEVAKLALHEPKAYAAMVTQSHDSIATFGGIFLILVFCSFLIDQEKIHWNWLERKIADCLKGCDINAIESGLFIGALGLFLILACGLPYIPALIGIGIFLLIRLLDGAMESCKILSGILGFLYLEVLDASFSLDGIVAAFSVNSDIFVIMTGLGIGALTIRSMTVHLVRKNTLSELPYLEHGAHWGIGLLGVLMLVGTHIAIPEILPGILAVSIIGMAVVSSLRLKAATAP